MQPVVKQLNTKGSQTSSLPLELELQFLRDIVQSKIIELFRTHAHCTGLVRGELREFFRELDAYVDAAHSLSTKPEAALPSPTDIREPVPLSGANGRLSAGSGYYQVVNSGPNLAMPANFVESEWTGPPGNYRFCRREKCGPHSIALTQPQIQQPSCGSEHEATEVTDGSPSSIKNKA